MAISLRPVQKSDLQCLAEIYVEVYTVFDVGERWSVDTAKTFLSYLLERQPSIAFVAECGGVVVGAFFAAIKPWWNGNHLFDGEIFVHPDFQKRGIGTELSEKLYLIALEKYDVVSFDKITFKKTEFPLSWYKDQGFEVNDDWALISAENLSLTISRLKKKNV
ncbi:MAG: GNAT family N-acetyltransferase [Candidatus Diapherotrites archaeon]|nr:GNAT family N-acetyltransferase [Candidatus Diapherotrites archaeon]